VRIEKSISVPEDIYRQLIVVGKKFINESTADVDVARWHEGVGDFRL
jgi:hypothetical protein